MAVALGALAFLVGCGAVERTNDPRPSPAVRVSVTVSPSAVTVQPQVIGIGPDRTQQTPQNVHSPQPPIRTHAPLTVAFVSANLTDISTRLEIRGPKDAVSGPLVANGNGTLQVDLPTGVYTVTAADMPRAKPGRLAIGPFRASSQNDVLLP
jgi:hypothetical protein